MPGRDFSVVVAKEYLKFAAAHFIAYPGFRERLHGHNYQMSVRIEADLGPEGYVLDFGLVKRLARALCEELDERVIVPERSDCLEVTVSGDEVTVVIEDGRRFVLPAGDVRLLPIVHSSAEELASYLLARMRGDDLRGALAAGCHAATSIIARFPRRDIGRGEIPLLGTPTDQREYA